MMNLKNTTSGSESRSYLPAKISAQLSFPVVLILILLINTALQAEEDSPSEMIYKAFAEEKMHLWEKAIEMLEYEYKQTGKTGTLYELVLARYGYIGYNLGADNESVAREQISLAEENIDILTISSHYESSAYAFQAAMYAYRISMSPWKAVFWGRKSMNLIEKAIETDPDNPSGWIENGNAMFYAPEALGGSKEKAVESYSRAIRLLEKNMKDIHRWLYLNTLVGLAKSYQETGDRALARQTYLKALKFEPEFKWVKNKLLPELLKEL